MTKTVNFAGMSVRYVQQGVDFVGYFAEDNFTSRRTTGHNMFDPDSFITGKELEAGLTYGNSARAFPTFDHYHQAVVGTYTPEEVAALFPRVRIN